MLAKYYLYEGTDVKVLEIWGNPHDREEFQNLEAKIDILKNDEKLKKLTIKVDGIKQIDTGNFGRIISVTNYSKEQNISYNFAGLGGKLKERVEQSKLEKVFSPNYETLKEAINAHSDS